MDLNATVALSTDDDDLYESCLSPSTFLLSSDDDDSYTGTDGNDNAVHEPYFDSLQQSANNADEFHCRTAVAEPVGLQQQLSSLQNSHHKNATHSPTTRSHSPREQSKKDGVCKPNTNQSNGFLSDLTSVSEPDGLLSETFSSLHLSSNSSAGESWLTSDLSTVTVLSDSDSSCSIHSVRIERKPVTDGNDDKCSSLVETSLIPTNHATDATIPCQHGNLECSYLSDNRNLLCDWKSGSEMDSDAEVEVTVPAPVKAMSAAELRSRLAEFGEIPGPIVDSTRCIHELRLSRLLAGHDRQRLTAGNGYSAG